MNQTNDTTCCPLTNTYPAIKQQIISNALESLHFSVLILTVKTALVFFNSVTKISSLFYTPLRSNKVSPLTKESDLMNSKIVSLNNTTLLDDMTYSQEVTIIL